MTAHINVRLSWCAAHSPLRCHAVHILDGDDMHLLQPLFLPTMPLWPLMQKPTAAEERGAIGDG